MVETYFLIPVNSNAGEPFPKEKYRALQGKLLAAFGGWTYGGRAHGAWRDDQGVVYEEETERYVVGIETLDDYETLLEILRWACEEFDQYCIYLAANGLTQYIAR